jgi:hypothetical protein
MRIMQVLIVAWVTDSCGYAYELVEKRATLLDVHKRVLS